MVIIEISMLRNVTGHPIPRTLKNKQIENAVVNRCTAFDLFSEI